MNNYCFIYYSKRFCCAFNLDCLLRFEHASDCTDCIVSQLEKKNLQSIRSIADRFETASWSKSLTGNCIKRAAQEKIYTCMLYALFNHLYYFYFAVRSDCNTVLNGSIPPPWIVNKPLLCSRCLHVTEENLKFGAPYYFSHCQMCFSKFSRKLHATITRYLVTRYVIV